MTTPDRAEHLWERLGGDLCVCQRADVPHWCEGCQGRIALITTELQAPADRSGVEALIAKWRAESGSWEPGIASGMEMCADELAAALKDSGQ